MLCMNSYPKAYIDDCRRRIDAQRSFHVGEGPEQAARGAF